MGWLAVALFSGRVGAEPAKKLLAEAGFKTKIQGESWLHFLWFVPSRQAGVWLEVAADEFERAEDFLRGLDRAHPALAQAIRCPECGSLRVEYPQFAKNSLLTNLALGVAAQAGLVERDYYCEHCHFTWPRQGSRPRRDRPHLAPNYFIEGVEQTSRKATPPEEQRDAA